ncbi:MAG: endonuclease/exonuclease/phosphatase family protein [Alphaproteobacteria bacterium]|nr:endonuclease/exonuclease/phosphatase family protein [Alphaproteobacteria bacterium]MBU0859300.1 endonuclease/exonuclease/phosphatase family protein [Alphaproteobacteria bacterium]
MAMTRRQFTFNSIAAGAAIGTAPLLTACARTPVSLRVATWNLASAAPKYFGSGLKDAALWIKDNGIDICAMQETDRHARTSNYIDFAKFLEDATGFEAFYGAASIEQPHEPGRPPREYGNLLLSRFPMVEKHMLNLGGPREPERLHEWGTDNRVVLFAKIQPNGQDCWIGATHLSATVTDSTYIARKFQNRNLLHHMNAVAGPRTPVILGGDFNTAPDSEEMQILYRELTNHTRNVGYTWPLDHTQPQQNPSTSIDHILGRHTTATNPRKHDFEKISDHSVVVVDLTLRP